MSGYTCVGSVRGCCGAVHATRDQARACIAVDRAGCASQGGYSDRRIIDGENYTYSERCAAGDEVMRALQASRADEIMGEANFRERVRDLQRAAGAAGDMEQVALCRIACGDEETASPSEIAAARAECARVISDGEAQS